jgi:hypothetical protein
VRESLATAINEAFWIAMVFAIFAVFIGVFMKELPMRRVIDIEGQPFGQPEPEPLGEPEPRGALSPSPAIPPVAGGSDAADHQPAG